MTSTWKGAGGLKVSYIFADSLAFDQKIYCYVLQMVGVGITKLIISRGGINVWSLNDLKLQSIQLLEAEVSSSTSNQTHFDCIENNPPNQSIHYFQLTLNLLVKNIVAC